MHAPLAVKLRTTLRALLAGWEQDIPSQWRSVLQETKLDWTSKSLDREVRPGETILPGRKSIRLPGVPERAHIFRALENTDPAHVRAVLLGQEPYPKAHWATGRAFEQGNLEAWPEEPRKVADSLRRLVQAMVSADAGNPAYGAGDRGWQLLIQDVRSGQCRLIPPKELFDYLERQGMLFLNTSLTVSSIGLDDTPKENRGHFHLWAPLVARVLRFLASRQHGHMLFLLFGRHAEAVFDNSGARTAAQNAGAWETRADAVRHFHPAAITSNGPAFLTLPNPFMAGNELLRRMGAEPICWGINRG